MPAFTSCLDGKRAIRHLIPLHLECDTERSSWASKWEQSQHQCLRNGEHGWNQFSCVLMICIATSLYFVFLPSFSQSFSMDMVVMWVPASETGIGWERGKKKKKKHYKRQFHMVSRVHKRISQKLVLLFLADSGNANLAGFECPSAQKFISVWSD